MEVVVLVDAFDALEIGFRTDELLARCPVTEQRDHYQAQIELTATATLESKSLKLYLWSFRDEGAFHEDVTNRILDDLVDAIAPRRMTGETLWNVRGGITTSVSASHP